MPQTGVLRQSKCFAVVVIQDLGHDADNEFVCHMHKACNMLPRVDLGRDARYAKQHLR